MLTLRLKAAALAAGADDVGVCRAETWPEMLRLDTWLERGDHGEMWYMEQRRDLRVCPQAFFSKARFAVMVVKAYGADPDGPPAGDGHAEISRHAVGEDYHTVLRRILKPIKDELRAAGHAYRAFTDVAPVMEKVLAARAGLGGIGRNTLLIHPRLGSWVFVGGVMTDAPLDTDTSGPPASPCGECRRCIDACPGGALRDDGSLNATRCLSYWTTESNVPELPFEVRQALGQRVFGCDRCQEVCPHNRGRAKALREQEARRFPVSELAGLGEAGFEARFGTTTMARLGWTRFVRNLAAIARPSPTHESDT